MYNIFLSLRIVFTLTNSVDPDEMLHSAAFHLSLHCLSKSQFRGSQYTMFIKILGILICAAFDITQSPLTLNPD